MENALELGLVALRLAATLLGLLLEEHGREDHTLARLQKLIGLDESLGGEVIAVSWALSLTDELQARVKLT